MVALPRHLVALFLKIVTFNTVLMVLKIVTLLYNGHLCFFNGDRFEVINTTLVVCIPVILSIGHVLLMCLTWFWLIFCLISQTKITRQATV